MAKRGAPLYYPDYLQLDRLLDCQHLESASHDAVAHDEMLFIITHQAYELWFKQILWELDAVRTLFEAEAVAEKRLGKAVSHLIRIVEIQRVIIGQIDVLETMTPLDFLDFRDYLIPASGFQSLQFRLIENKLGIRPAQRLNIDRTPYEARFEDPDRQRLKASEQQASLFDLVDKWLARTPFLHFGDYDFWDEYHLAVDAMLAKDRQFIEQNPMFTSEKRANQLRMLDDTTRQFDALFDETRYEALRRDGLFRLSHQALQAALLINLYRDEPILYLPFRLLSLLMDIDENFTKWRYRHALMVLRMIGRKIGTGGSSGHDYLRQTAEQHRVFTDLFSLSTFFIPRSALPDLPDKVRAAMGFQFSEGSS